MSLKEKRKAKKRRTRSDSDSEHELFYYANDRVRLMKEVLKVLKLKKIKSLAPDGIKSMDIEEMNTMLLEELLGISNKRLKKIFDGCNADDESSSSDEDKAIDIISLDSISDDDICFIDETINEPAVADHKSGKHKGTKIKKEGEVAVKSGTKAKDIDKATTLDNSNLLSVLELLELQARARAIRSQLALETEYKAKEEEEQANCSHAINDDDDDVQVVVELPTVNEIVISSSDSEQEIEKSLKNEEQSKGTQTESETKSIPQVNKPQKVTLIQSIIVDAKNVSAIPLPSHNDEDMNNFSNKEENAEDVKPITGITIDDDVIHLDIVEIDDIDDP